MRYLPVWVLEFVKLLGGRRLYPVVTECPFCHQMVRLHVNKAGRRHMYAHARELYEGSRLSEHYTAKVKCVGSGSPKAFDPHPDEHLHFKLPSSLRDE